MRVIALIFFSFFVGDSFSQQIIHVPDDYTTIQGALDNAIVGSEIWVAPGTYFEHLIWPARIDSIRLISEEGSTETIIDGQSNGRVLQIGEQTKPFVNIQTITTGTIIEGFTLKNGYLKDDFGAGLMIGYASPALIDLVIESNIIDVDISGHSTILNRTGGAGAMLIDYKGSIENCHFRANEIRSQNSALGGGLFLILGDNVEINNCSFSNNTINSVEGAYGGGLFATSKTTFSISLNNCLVENNVINGDIVEGAGAFFQTFGGFPVLINSSSFMNNKCQGVNISQGGAICSGTKQIELNKCHIEGNSAIEGGGIFLKNLATNSQDIAVFDKTILYDNTANIGAAIFVYPHYLDLTMNDCQVDHNNGEAINFSVNDFLTSFLRLNHTTIAFNSGPIITKNTDILGINSILWENGEENITTDQSEIKLTNCVINGDFQGENLINSDPLFVDEFDLRPLENSPCISAGILLGQSSSDLLGNQRPLPMNTLPDIGAYEINQNVSSTKNIEGVNQTIIYPNPTKEKLLFSEKVDYMKLYSSSGQLALSVKNSNEANINGFPAGIYWIVLRTSGKTISKSIVITK